MTNLTLDSNRCNNQGSFSLRNILSRYRIMFLSLFMLITILTHAESNVIYDTSGSEICSIKVGDTGVTIEYLPNVLLQIRSTSDMSGTPLDHLSSISLSTTSSTSVKKFTRALENLNCYKHLDCTTIPDTVI